MLILPLLHEKEAELCGCLASDLGLGQAVDQNENSCPMGYSEVQSIQGCTHLSESGCGVFQPRTAKFLKTVIATHLVGEFMVIKCSCSATPFVILNIIYLVVYFLGIVSGHRLGSYAQVSILQ